MIKANNIAKTILLIAVFLLLVVPRYAHAQNTSYTPYLNSTQKYRVPIGNGVDRKWELRNTLVSPTVTKDLTLEDSGGATWITVGTEVEGTTTYAWITIKYIPEAPTSFAKDQTWYLVYSEWNGNNCTAMRATPEIKIFANDFSLACGDDDADCNSWSGKVFPNSTTITDPEKSKVEFTVNMSKNATHLVRKWSFSGTIEASGTSFENPISTDPLFDVADRTGNTTNGTYSIVWTSGNTFTVTVTMNDLNGDNHASDVLTFKANIHGPPTSKVVVTLTIANGQAFSGGSSHIVTEENGFAAGDNNQVITINPIPATSVISMVD